MIINSKIYGMNPFALFCDDASNSRNDELWTEAPFVLLISKDEESQLGSEGETGVLDRGKHEEPVFRRCPFWFRKFSCGFTVNFTFTLNSRIYFRYF